MKGTPWIVSFLLAVGLRAQERANDFKPIPIPGPPIAEEGQVVADVLFSVYVWPTEGILTTDSTVPSLPRTFFTGLQGMERIYLNRGGSSHVHHYRGPLPLELYDVEREWVAPPEDAPPEARPVLMERRIPILRATFPAEARRIVLIAFPHEKDPEGGMVTFPMPVMNTTLRPGDVTLYNADKRPVAFSINDSNNPVLLKPYETLYLQKDSFATVNPRVKIHRRDASGTTRLAASTRMYVDPEKANYFFLYPSGDRHMRLLRVGTHDLPPPPAP
jgi:hypothetical protein